MNWTRKVVAVGALVCLLAGSAAMATAQRGYVRFVYQGGNWSHHRHAGWNRYWGGPSVGFYWAPEPAYVVPGYYDPYYYSGPDYWYSNPSFGLSFNLGGGGGGWRDRDHRDRHFQAYRRGGFERDRARGERGRYRR